MASPAGSTRAKTRQLAVLRRGHWTIENRNHYVRDENPTARTAASCIGTLAQALAALHNAVLNVLRYQGFSSIPAAIRRYGASVQKTLTLLGVATP